jgi:pimeloyl-ACP methyl ester carboxylesterase
MTNYAELPNLRVTSRSGVSYAYRDTGGDGVPLVVLQHFRGTLDNWDPALIDDLASVRRVVAFDNVGVAGSDGISPHTIAGMAAGALDFLDAMDLRKVDLLGFQSEVS